MGRRRASDPSSRRKVSASNDMPGMGCVCVWCGGGAQTDWDDMDGEEGSLHKGTLKRGGVSSLILGVFSPVSTLREAAFIYHQVLGLSVSS
jgi:hypothetical protein